MREELSAASIHPFILPSNPLPLLLTMLLEALLSSIDVCFLMRLLQWFVAERPEERSGALARLTEDVADELEDLLVAVAGFGQCAGGQTGGSLLLHQLMLALFSLRKLSRYDDQTQV